MLVDAIARLQHGQQPLHALHRRRHPPRHRRRRRQPARRLVVSAGGPLGAGLAEPEDGGEAVQALLDPAEEGREGFVVAAIGGGGGCWGRLATGGRGRGLLLDFVVV